MRHPALRLVLTVFCCKPQLNKKGLIHLTKPSHVKQSLFHLSAQSLRIHSILPLGVPVMRAMTSHLAISKNQMLQRSQPFSPS